jgi:hypothetical protein
MISRRLGLRMMVVVTIAILVVDLMLPWIPQPHSYHAFADQRSFLGVYHSADVVSNAPFAIFGRWGLILYSPRSFENIFSTEENVGSASLFPLACFYFIRFRILSVRSGQRSVDVGLIAHGDRLYVAGSGAHRRTHSFARRSMAPSSPSGDRYKPAWRSGA